MGWGSFVTGQTFMCLDPFLNLFLTLSKTSWAKCVLELFLHLFLIFSKTFLEHNVFLNCSYICS